MSLLNTRDSLQPTPSHNNNNGVLHLHSIKPLTDIVEDKNINDDDEDEDYNKQE